MKIRRTKAGRTMVADSLDAEVRLLYAAHDHWMRGHRHLPFDSPEWLYHFTARVLLGRFILWGPAGVPEPGLAPPRSG